METNQLAVSWDHHADVCYALAEIESCVRLIELSLFRQKGTDWERVDRFRKRIHDITE